MKTPFTITYNDMKEMIYLDDIKQMRGSCVGDSYILTIVFHYDENKVNLKYYNLEDYNKMYDIIFNAIEMYNKKDYL